mgnify:CR=1 FL=1|jgi:hypothetical protein
MKKTLIIFFSTLFSISAQANIITCEKGVVEMGDSYEVVISKCGESNSYQAGMKNYKTKEVNKRGFNVTVAFQFRQYKKSFPDGKHINFIFIENQLMFVTD